MSRESGNARGPGEGLIQRLMRSAFRPAGASAEFRDRLIRTSLNILSDHLSRKPGLTFDEPGGTHRHTNRIGGDAVESLRRAASDHHANRLDQSSDAEAEIEDRSSEYRARRRGAGF